MEIQGSEEGWRAASDPSDSRYHDKQKAIKKLVAGYENVQKKGKRNWEKQLDDDFDDAAVEVAAGLIGTVKVGYSRRYAANFEKVFGGK